MLPALAVSGGVSSLVQAPSTTARLPSVSAPEMNHAERVNERAEVTMVNECPLLKNPFAFG
jgi:hypothetical protein